MATNHRSDPAHAPVRRTVVWRALAAAVIALVAVSEVASQTVQTQRVMREKLERAQRLLGAVVTSNWTALDRDVRGLEALTNDPAWGVLRTPQYARGADAFLRELQDLRDAAGRRDPEATPLAYVAVTLSCIRCHQDMARARLAAGPAR
jgi:hypothetical protein